MKQVRFRVYTEDKNRRDIVQAFSHRFEAFTVYTASGYWKGTPEASLIFEVITPRNGAGNVERVIQEYSETWLKRFNKQAAVLITREVTEVSII